PRLLRDAAHQAPPARGRGGGQDRRQDGLPARRLHLPRNLGRHDRPRGDQVHHRPLPHGGESAMRRLVARNASLGTVIADKVGVADSRATRAVGLLSRSGLEPGEALWIVPSRGVHTWGMRFTIDVLALDEAGTVIDCVSNLRPWRMRLPKRGTA